MAGDCPAFDVRRGRVDGLRHYGCYKRVRCCLGGGGEMHYLLTCRVNSKGADAAEPDEAEFWSRVSCLLNKRH